MTNNKYLKNYARITTSDNKVFTIKKIRIYIGGKINYYGKQYVIKPENSENNDLKILDEIYSLDEKEHRFRFLSDTISNPVIFDTIEHSADNSEEKPIRVIEDYENFKTEIISIPNVVTFESDTCIYNKGKLIDKNMV